jgi:hypothetical protein
MECTRKFAKLMPSTHVAFFVLPLSYPVEAVFQRQLTTSTHQQSQGQSFTETQSIATAVKIKIMHASAASKYAANKKKARTDVPSAEIQPVPATNCL